MTTLKASKNNREKFTSSWREWANESRRLAHSTNSPQTWDKIREARINLMELIDEVARDLYSPTATQ